ncbi:NAD(P)-dependent oxidoreductase [Phaeobacter marinintestinus]|uniref:NAD(P)-dependent oxidoreductase n=1 Tax=Falsiphaeobacter marinintestinus TaxID=1492905 RepID=UPI0011B4A59E|nr:NAD(P)-dependent oxidoreductase [Phaeobacter marinintestinus]
MNRSAGVFGLGLVGTALAGRLLRSGRSVAGFDPDPARCKLLEDAAGQASDPGLVWQQDYVFSCVFDTDQLSDLIAQAPERDGACLISISTCDPMRMSGLGMAAAQKGWRLIEAPISGTSKQLAMGDAVFLVGGDPADAQALSVLLGTIGRSQHYVGPLGNGNRAKLAVNLVLGLNRAALAEGLVFANRVGLAPDAFLELLQDTAAASAVMKTKGPKMVAQDFDAQGRIEQSAKDFGLILTVAAEQRQGLPFARTYAAMMRDCMDNDEAGLDNAAIIKAIARAGGVE